MDLRTFQNLAIGNVLEHVQMCSSVQTLHHFVKINEMELIIPRVEMSNIYTEKKNVSLWQRGYSKREN